MCQGPIEDIHGLRDSDYKQRKRDMVIAFPPWLTLGLVTDHFQTEVSQSILTKGEVKPNVCFHVAANAPQRYGHQRCQTEAGDSEDVGLGV